MKNSKTKTEVASSAETSKPDKPEVVQDSAIAVQGKPEEKPVSEDDAKIEFVSITELAKRIPDKFDLTTLASFDIAATLKGFLQWGYIMEESVKAQGKALQQLGVNLQPVVELAQKVKAQQTAAPAGSPQKDAGGLQMLMGLLQQSGLVGGQGGMSEGDRYFMEMGRESASLGNFVAKELFKKMMPEAIAKFDSERAAAK